ncbi:type II toxin-antitoxin system prevent-host-death family antitoxin [Nocardioides sp.]|uniref:type II toxin-antitoxin system Phd/YefM family antitoxin n=1 Tax=Nocardioides sp. TaxID=35761 RepID=UPI002ED8DD21
MDAVASRDLRNHTADVLRRVGEGGVVAVTVRGEVVAELHPPGDARPRSWRRAELAAWLTSEQADAGLRADLRVLAGESTDDLGPLT